MCTPRDTQSCTCNHIHTLPKDSLAHKHVLRITHTPKDTHRPRHTHSHTQTYSRLETFKHTHTLKNSHTLYTHVNKETHTKAHVLVCRCIHAPTGTPKDASIQDLHKSQKTESRKASTPQEGTPLNPLPHVWTPCSLLAPILLLSPWPSPHPGPGLPSPPHQGTWQEKRSKLFKRHPEGLESGSWHPDLGQWPCYDVAQRCSQQPMDGVTPDLGTTSGCSCTSWRCFSQVHLESP